MFDPDRGRAECVPDTSGMGAELTPPRRVMIDDRHTPGPERADDHLLAVGG